MATKPLFSVTGSRSAVCSFCLKSGGKILLDKNSGKGICTDCLRLATAFVKEPLLLPAPKDEQ